MVGKTDMIRFLSDGILVGYMNVVFWSLVPFSGSFLAMFVWYVLRSFIEWRMPDKEKLKAAREEDRQTILILKSKLCDTLVEMVRAQKAEKQMSQVLEEMRSSHRNLNARATDALGGKQ